MHDLEEDNSDESILAGEGLLDSGNWPVTSKGRVFTYEHYVSDLQIISGCLPFGENLQLLQILPGPGLPEVVNYRLAHGPALEEGWLHVNHSLRSTHKKMSRSKDLNAIWTVAVER